MMNFKVYDKFKKKFKRLSRRIYIYIRRLNKRGEINYVSEVYEYTEEEALFYDNRIMFDEFEPRQTASREAYPRTWFDKSVIGITKTLFPEKSLMFKKNHRWIMPLIGRSTWINQFNDKSKRKTLGLK